MSNSTTDQSGINVNIAQAHGALNHGWTVLGTLLACGAVGMMAWAVSMAGMLDLAATGLSFFFVQLVSMMFKAGLIVIPDNSEKDFSQTGGLLKTAWREFQEFQGRSPIWRMALLAFGFTLSYMTFRWGLSVALGIFSNIWIAGGVSALIASLIVAPNLFSGMAQKMKSKSGVSIRTTAAENEPEPAGEEAAAEDDEPKPAGEEVAAEDEPKPEVEK